MSQFQADNFQQSRRVRVAGQNVHRSKLALAAVAIGLVAWALPLAPLLVVGLALLAWKAIRTGTQQNKTVTGKPFVGAALALGIVGIGLQGVVGYQGFTVYRQLSDAPAAAIAQGTTGNTQAFLAAFDTDSGQLYDAELFLTELQKRYGTFLRATANQPAPILQVLRGDTANQTYVFEFSDAVVSTEAQLACPEPTAMGLPAAPKLHRLTFDDPTHGELTFPDSTLPQISIVDP